MDDPTRLVRYIDTTRARYHVKSFVVDGGFDDTLGNYLQAEAIDGYELDRLQPVNYGPQGEGMPNDIWFIVITKDVVV